MNLYPGSVMAILICGGEVFQYPFSLQFQIISTYAVSPNRETEDFV